MKTDYGGLNTVSFNGVRRCMGICGDSPRMVELAYDSGEEKCRVCLSVAETALREYHWYIYEKLKKDPNYRDVEYDAVSGGVKAEHVGHKHATDQSYFQKEKVLDSMGFGNDITEIICTINDGGKGRVEIIKKAT